LFGLGSTFTKVSGLGLDSVQRLFGSLAKRDYLRQDCVAIEKGGA
jgi:hypothetical protein